MNLIENNLLRPYKAVTSTNFSGALFIARLLKRIATILLIFSLIILLPKWIGSNLYNLFAQGNPSTLSNILFEIFIYGTIPLLLIIAADALALLISSEEKLRCLHVE